MPNLGTGRLIILASTRMLNGICVAGVDRDSRWVRPVNVPEFDFSPQQLSQAGRVVVEPYNDVEFRLGQRLNNSPQSEDVEAIVSEHPRLVRTLDENELLALMRQKDEHDKVAEHGDDLEGWLVGMNRSLVLTRVDELLTAYRNTYNERRQRRIVFRVGNKILNLPCTDLRWRKITRDDRDAEAMNTLKSAKTAYFALGLARVFQGHYYPMVVGVHPLPKLVSQVDYDDL